MATSPIAGAPEDEYGYWSGIDRDAPCPECRADWEPCPCDGCAVCGWGCECAIDDDYAIRLLRASIADRAMTRLAHTDPRQTASVCALCLAPTDHEPGCPWLAARVYCGLPTQGDTP